MRAHQRLTFNVLIVEVFLFHVWLQSKYKRPYTVTVLQIARRNVCYDILR